MSSEQDASITADAEAALATYLEIERKKILRRARLLSTERDDTHEIDASDILNSLSVAEESLDDTNRRAFMDYQIARRARLVQVVKVYGQTLLLIGALMAVYFQFRAELETTTIIAIAIAAAGSIISTSLVRLLSVSGPIPNLEVGLRTVVREPHQSEESNPAQNYAIESTSTDNSSVRQVFLNAWLELENAVRTVAQRNARLDEGPLSLRDLVTKLVEHGEMTYEDADIFFNALRLRNRLVHTFDKTVMDQTIIDTLSEVEHLKYHFEGLL